MSAPAISSATLTANRRIVDQLASASTGVTHAQSALQGGQRAHAGQLLAKSLDNLHQAQAGINALTDRMNLLDGAAPRWAFHADVSLTSAVSLLSAFTGERLVPDVRAGLLRDVNDAAMQMRLATEAGTRSLKSPAQQAKIGSTYSPSGPDNQGASATWVDGQWLDVLGNPAPQGANAWGPDDGNSDGFNERETSGNGPDDTGSDGVFLG